MTVSGGKAQVILTIDPDKRLHSGSLRRSNVSVWE
jgi:hypothetical protein